VRGGVGRSAAADGNENELASLTVRARRRQRGQLLAWPAPFAPRTWAVEAANESGYLLSQQLIAAGEAVLDVPATMAAQVRVLGNGRWAMSCSNPAMTAMSMPSSGPVIVTPQGRPLLRPQPRRRGGRRPRRR
jgi:hypothetical protein